MLEFLKGCLDVVVFWILAIFIVFTIFFVNAMKEPAMKEPDTNCTKINDDVKRCTLPNGDICYMWNNRHHGSGMSCKFKDK